MRFVGKTIDASGNFILSRNDIGMYIEGISGMTIVNFRIHNTGGSFLKKVRTSFKALVFIWTGFE